MVLCMLCIKSVQDFQRNLCVENLHCTKRQERLLKNGAKREKRQKGLFKIFRLYNKVETKIAMILKEIEKNAKNRQKQRHMCGKSGEKSDFKNT